MQHESTPLYFPRSHDNLQIIMKEYQWRAMIAYALKGRSKQKQVKTHKVDLFIDRILCLERF